MTFAPGAVSLAQDTVTGAFLGTVTDTRTRRPVPGALVEIINQRTGIVIVKRTEFNGTFFQPLLAPGTYRIRVTIAGYRTREILQRLYVSRSDEVVPVPISLEPSDPGAPAAAAPDLDFSIRTVINTTDARRGGSFTDEEVSTLPLGSSTFTRTFDELALLLPGVTPPPQTLGSVSGPGVGAGVGSAGQFAVNGLRSRANNFTVDGSDNNDEDIGVRRQGFLALIPQSVESIQEYQVTTLLAPAQFGRNIGAQVNAVSKSGGAETHGSLYGFFNSSQLNARNFFDTAGSGGVSQLRENNQAVFLQDRAFIRFIDNYVANNNSGVGATRPLSVRGGGGGEDSFTLGQAGFVLGGPVWRPGVGGPRKLFYFVSAESQMLNATQEASFIVPTVAERGVFGTGLTGFFRNPLTGQNLLARNFTGEGSAVLSLYPFPNNPGGIYGANTFTQTLPAGGRGLVMSGKVDGNFEIGGRPQTATARYNFTNDRRDIPVTGEALFSGLRSRVRTQNLSTFLNSEISGSLFNQVRLSYGRTRLVFDELRDREFLIPSTRFPGAPFLLNAPLLVNVTRAPGPGVPNTGDVIFATFPGRVAAADLARAVTAEDLLGPVGQIRIAGFSSVGVDVFNFPQRRVNNTYQAADTLTYRSGRHNIALGADVRRSELNSELPRNSRTLISFSGAPRFTADPVEPPPGVNTLQFAGFIRPIDQAGTAAASGVFQSLATTGSGINLRFYQLNFFAQDEWRIRPRLSLSYGLRYEYNTPPRESNRRIENTFNDPALDLPGVSGLKTFIAGRERIFEPDRNNFAPRLGIAYSPELFNNRLSVVRAGFGVFFDQILGAVVSQSRNVFPNFLTLNTGGGLGSLTGGTFGIINPAFTSDENFDGDQLCVTIVNLRCALLRTAVTPGTLNTLNPAFPLGELVLANSRLFPGGFGATLPARELDMPAAYHYNVSFEQQLSRALTVEAAYVGTQGRRLLRFTTPNLGENVILAAYNINPGLLSEPTDSTRFFTSFRGVILAPGRRPVLGARLPVGDPGSVFIGGRPVADVGAVTLYESSATSRYDSLQLRLRGRHTTSVQYQIAYTLSKATDDVSDVFDLAGAPALPQNSLTLAGERAPANFDARHRFSYNVVYDFPSSSGRGRLSRLLLGGLRLASTGRFQTGQPFTVNSVFDVNLDGNLTDRLNRTDGIVRTGDRRAPLRLAADPVTLLAPLGQDGSVGRNTFRSGNILELDLSASKRFALTERQNLELRVDVFNFINRANFGVPVRFLEAPGFGSATDTVTPGRRAQFALKYSF